MDANSLNGNSPVTARRSFLKLSCLTFASTMAASFRCIGWAAAPIALQLAREFTRTRLFDISPDGRKLCLEDWASNGYPFRIVEIGTWRQLYAKKFGYRISAGFFADSQSLLIDLGVRAGSKRQRQGALNTLTDALIEQTFPFDYEEGEEAFFPLENGIILLKHAAHRPRFETTTLSIVRFADGSKIAEAPFATRARVPLDATKAFPYLGESINTYRLSADAKVLVYAFDDVLVCRDAASLNLSWTRVEQGMRCLDLAVSAAGDFVAVAFVDAGYMNKSRSDRKAETYYTAVYDGQSGREIARLPIFAEDHMAISPKGDLLAVVKPEGSNGVAKPTVYLHELPSGRVLTSVVHDEIKGSSPLGKGCIVEFTSDGKYLVTAGMTTKIWSILL